MATGIRVLVTQGFPPKVAGLHTMVGRESRDSEYASDKRVSDGFTASIIGAFDFDG